MWVSIALIGIIGTLYTAIGGFKSVVWTDVFQLTLVLVGVFAIIIKGNFYLSMKADKNSSKIAQAGKTRRKQNWATKKLKGANLYEMS